MPKSPDHFDDAKARAVAWLTSWDSQGTHRTGTAGDEAGAHWLAHEAAALGVGATTEAFELARLDPVACCLEVGGERISAVPAYDAPPTGGAGLTGTLGLTGYDEAILVAKLAPQSVYTGEYERLRQDAEHRALVIICAGAHSGMALLNAERFRHPYGAPAELGRAGQAPDLVAPETLVPSGETRDIHRAGGRYVTLVGSNPLFHLPQDRWPDAVDTDVVIRVAAAAAALVVKLAR